MIEAILVLCLITLGAMALSNTKKPVEPSYRFDDRYDQRQFDNAGCRWPLIVLFFGAGLAFYGIYLIFNSF